ncbi:hypothetical protein AX16_003479 [Volvariella volvacea WC 439]|nr:hypothetical protein AX16_003479 [Volvariella volvacea WC 439]
MHTAQPIPLDPLKLIDPNTSSTLLSSSLLSPMSSSAPTTAADPSNPATTATQSHQSQTLYMPIAGPPTPAPSPSPPDSHRNSTLMPHPFTLLSPQANPTLRRQYLVSILQSCTPAELLFISTTIAPLLKRDFLASLPIELALHILSFIDDPRTLARASQVSRTWRRLVSDEWVWKQMCLASGYDDWDEEELPHFDAEPNSTSIAISSPSPSPYYPTGSSDPTATNATANSISPSLVGPSTSNLDGQSNSLMPAHIPDPSSSRSQPEVHLTSELQAINNSNGHEPLVELERFAHCPMDPALEWLTTRTRSQQSSGPSSPSSSSFLTSSSVVSPTTETLSGASTLLYRSDNLRRHDDPQQRPFSYQQHFKESYIIMQNWRHGGHLLREHALPVVEPDNGVITSLSIDSDWVVAGLANSKIHIFSAKTGVLARTLVGHDLGVWGVCLVSKGGSWVGGPVVGAYEREDEEMEDGDKRDAGQKQDGWDYIRRGNTSSSSSSRRHREGRSARTGRRGQGIGGGLAAAAPSSSGGMNNTRALDQYLPPSLRVALGLDPFHPSVRREYSDGMDEDMMECSSSDKGKGKAPIRNRSSPMRMSSPSCYDNMDDTPQPEPGPSSSSTPPKRPENQCGASNGWGQPNSIVVSGGCDKILRVWDINTGYCIYALPGHTSTIRCIKVLDGRPVAVTGARDATLRVWDVQKGRMLRVLEGHHQSVRCLDVCGNKVVSGSYDTTCRLWDVDTGECIHVLRGHYHQIYSVAYDGIRIASGGLDTTVRVWDAATGQCKALLTGHTALVCQLQLSPTILATGGSDGRVITFSLSTYDPLHRIAAHDSSVTSLQFDKHFLVTGGNDGRTRLFETETGNYVRDLSKGSESVWKVGFGGGRSGRDVCAVMCRRDGRTVIEIWSLRGERGGETEGRGEDGGDDDEADDGVEGSEDREKRDDGEGSGSGKTKRKREKQSTM